MVSEALSAGLVVHLDRHRAHARAERRGEEAAIAGADERTLGDRLAGGDREADDGADQLRNVGFAVEEIGVLHHVGRPELEVQRICGDDRPDRERALGDQYARSLRLDGGGLRLGRGCACKQAARHQRRADRDHQRADQQNEFLPIHGVTPPLEFRLRVSCVLSG